MLALAGGHPTIDLNDLKYVIERVQPKVVIPMHYRISGPRFFMLPISEFKSMYPDSMITAVGSNSLELSKETLPSATQIMILEPTNTRPNDYYEDWP